MITQEILAAKICLEEAITFDDVTLIHNYSDILPRDVDLSTNLTKNIRLKVPILSADMDTVTEREMAIAMSLVGGLGIIHKNLDPVDQAKEVQAVKRFRSGFINDPITLAPNMLISEVTKIREEKGYKNFPVTENGELNGKLIGFLSNSGYVASRHGHLTVCDRMMPYEELLIVTEGITIEEAFDVLIENRKRKLFVINNPVDRNLVSFVNRTDLEKNEQYPNAVKDKKERLLVGAAVGPSSDLKERAELLIKAGVDVLCVSTSHGDTAGVIACVKYLKQNYQIDVIAGNVVTAEGAEDLIQAGADCIKVGIGAGSICTTGPVTGAGMPQLTSVIDCTMACQKYEIPLISDGGIRHSGDISKALGAGASAVMLGNLLARTEESAGEKILLDGKLHKHYRGMGSEEALKTGSREKYRLSTEDRIIPEGVDECVPLSGKLADTISLLCGGVKGGFGVVGARNIPEMHKKARFRKRSIAAKIESHPHNIVVIKEAPNYSFASFRENR